MMPSRRSAPRRRGTPSKLNKFLPEQFDGKASHFSSVGFYWYMKALYKGGEEREETRGHRRETL
jgi:hypothetical protein